MQWIDWPEVILNAVDRWRANGFKVNLYKTFYGFDVFGEKPKVHVTLTVENGLKLVMGYAICTPAFRTLVKVFPNHIEAANEIVANVDDWLAGRKVEQDEVELEPCVRCDLPAVGWSGCQNDGDPLCDEHLFDDRSAINGKLHLQVAFPLSIATERSEQLTLF